MQVVHRYYRLQVRQQIANRHLLEHSGAHNWRPPQPAANVDIERHALHPRHEAQTDIVGTNHRPVRYAPTDRNLELAGQKLELRMIC